MKTILALTALVLCTNITLADETKSDAGAPQKTVDQYTVDSISELTCGESNSGDDFTLKRVAKYVRIPFEGGGGYSTRKSEDSIEMQVNFGFWDRSTPVKAYFSVYGAAEAEAESESVWSTDSVTGSRLVGTFRIRT